MYAAVGFKRIHSSLDLKHCPARNNAHLSMQICQYL